MTFRVGKISGIDDAIVSLLMSKRTHTEAKEKGIRELVSVFTNKDGFYSEECKFCGITDYKEKKQEFFDWLYKLRHYGLELGHETLLRFIDITVIVKGLHRGAGDDLDAHSCRMNNRIVRSSTRLSKKYAKKVERSDWYEGKILTFEEIIDKVSVGSDVDLSFKDKVTLINGEEWVKTPYGYVKKGYEEDNDVLRGLYPLSVPWDCIFKCNYVDLRHIYRVRGEHSSANPELRSGAEQMAGDLKEKLPVLGEVIDKEFVLTGYAGDTPDYGWVKVSEVKKVSLDYFEERKGFSA